MFPEGAGGWCRNRFEGVKKSRFAAASQGRPLWLPQGSHKGRPYNVIFSQLFCDVCDTLSRALGS
jgi:hypothetical protein